MYFVGNFFKGKSVYVEYTYICMLNIHTHIVCIHKLMVNHLTTSHEKFSVTIFFKYNKENSSVLSEIFIPKNTNI